VGALMKVFKNIFLSGNKYSTIFFIAGVFVSMLITSVGISTSIAYQQLMNTRYELEGEQYQLIVNPNGKLTDSFWDRLYNVLIDDSGLYINQINIPTSYASDYIPRSYPLLFKGNKGIFPLLEGKYFSYENVKNKDRIALVGKDAVLLLPEINGKRYVKLSGTSYEVIGVIGEKNKKTVWDKSVYFPINSLPDKDQSNLSGPQLQMVLYSRAESIDEQFEKVKALFSETGIDILQAQRVIPDKISFWQAISFRYQDNLIVYIFFIVSLINSLNIAMSWVAERRYEIGIKKAFGHSDGNIIKNLFLEMFLLFSVGAILAAAIHFLIFKFLSKFISFGQVFFIEAVFVSMVLAFVSTILTIAFSVSKILSIQPAEAVKG